MLSIITLLTGGVLGARGLVVKTTAAALVDEMTKVKHMLYAYRGKYGAVPGDHLTASAIFPAALTPMDTLGNDGRIESSAGWTGNSSTIDQDESGLFWNHVRLAKLDGGDPTQRYAKNMVQGSLGISSGRDMPARPAGVAGVYSVCSSNIEGHVAQIMDSSVDDGSATTGMLWASAEANNTAVTTLQATTPYAIQNRYTVCMAF